MCLIIYWSLSVWLAANQDIGSVSAADEWKMEERRLWNVQLTTIPPYQHMMTLPSNRFIRTMKHIIDKYSGLWVPPYNELCELACSGSSACKWLKPELHCNFYTLLFLLVTLYEIIPIKSWAFSMSPWTLGNNRPAINVKYYVLLMVLISLNKGCTDNGVR